MHISRFNTVLASVSHDSSCVWMACPQAHFESVLHADQPVLDRLDQ